MKDDITIQIVDIFRDKLGWQASYVEVEDSFRHVNLDGILKLNADKVDIDFVYQINKSVVPSSIPSIKRTLGQVDFKLYKAQSTILLANYISAKARDLLVRNKINYVDTAGNIYIKKDNIFIHIETGKSDRSSLSNTNGRAFTKAGLKVLYQFLRSERKSDNNGDLTLSNLNTSYKVLADQAKVSKDTVSKVVQDLLSQGYILKRNEKEYRWKDKQAVFEKWVSRVNEVLRPSLKSARYRSMNNKKDFGDDRMKGYMKGGYLAAENWVVLKPSQQIINPPYLIYTHKGFQNLQKDLKIVPDPDGNVTVMEAFWKDDSCDHGTADFPVLYADLIDSSDPRMSEIAELIYEKYIHDKL